MGNTDLAGLDFGALKQNSLDCVVVSSSNTPDAETVTTRADTSCERDTLTHKSVDLPLSGYF